MRYDLPESFKLCCNHAAIQGPRSVPQRSSPLAISDEPTSPHQKIRLCEGIGKGASHLGHTGHTTHKQYFIDVLSGNTGILQTVLAGMLCSSQQLLHQLLKPAQRIATSAFCHCDTHLAQHSLCCQETVIDRHEVAVGSRGVMGTLIALTGLQKGHVGWPHLYKAVLFKDGLRLPINNRGLEEDLKFLIPIGS